MVELTLQRRHVSHDGVTPP